MIKSINSKFCIAAVSLAVSSGLFAAEEDNKEKNENDGLGFDNVVVTVAGARKSTVMESSLSVTSLYAAELESASPRSTAEAFRIIPGVRAEASGGEGNANIAVRGLPVASGGAKFLQLQEDGLPVVMFGDIAFGNADIFLRIDSTVESIEAIRGGASSTAASNAPGGVINIISKNGGDDSGSVSTSFGLDYDEFRSDFEFGGAISNSLSFHVGGFVRQGEGPRETGYQAMKGGQIKANLTKEFDKGYVRLYFKNLNDKYPGYLPMPMKANGDSVEGFDAGSDTPHSAFLTTTLRLGSDGERSRGDIRNGMNPNVRTFGFEASFDLEDDWRIENRFRTSNITGNFASLFPAEIASSDDLAASIGGVGATLEYANGPQAGSSFSSDNVMRIHTFDVELNDFGSIQNEMKLTKDFENTSVAFGFYKASQNIGMSWLWNSYLMEIKGDNAALLNVVGADGTQYSENGLYAYGVPFWGNCCQRNYDSDYSIDAPFVSLSSKIDNLTIDASYRHDSGQANGTYAGAVTSEVDINLDGNISIPEQNVASIDNANASVVNYDWSYDSYSVGANYSINQDLAVFGRYSKGGRANADRLLFGKVRADGSVAEEDSIDEVTQFEAGVKYRADALSIFATLFNATTEEQNFEATSQNFFDREYEATGLEVEAAYRIGEFDIRGGLTWTDAEIAKDALNPGVVGNTPRRQADFIYSFIGRYNLANGSLGLSLIGTTDSYSQDNNDLELDGYTQANAFASYDLTESLSLSVSINNLFDTVGVTEAEEGSLPANGIIRGRSINGRTSSLQVKYEF